MANKVVRDGFGCGGGGGFGCSCGGGGGGSDSGETSARADWSTAVLTHSETRTSMYPPRLRDHKNQVQEPGTGAHQSLARLARVQSEPSVLVPLEVAAVHTQCTRWLRSDCGRRRGRRERAWSTISRHP
eukprot:CAMPEP_0185421054 /NCGR_PEP_ID=MMETSP1365-20130426/10733_1 /TAXON_ID=38817 /ORGANISM="Gephyrocapsa oceanica, Strain RCC1303" /LENGTH=128 /DNA_ID=CAMNT_0028024737 /DNA_START=891 /DNA_END=1274 /DNA_ORIENTATION=-